MGSNRKLQSWKGTLDSKGLRVNFKGALMQICVCVYIKKKYPPTFAFLIPRILELFMQDVSKFLKK